MVHGDPPPSQLGKYRLVAKLGEGGAATVYLAVASGPAGVNKLLVVKLLREELTADADVLNMFLEEARLCTRLSHPNIVQTIEVGMDAGRYFIVMEHLEGKPFSALVSVPGIGPDERVHLVAEALEGLHCAHELTDYDGTPMHVVHRDVSPQNLFVTYDGHAKLLDFGVAKARSSSTKTDLGVIKGKPRYMSPEQVQGAAVDRTADVFAAGVVLIEAVSGRRLWGDKNDVAVIYALGNGYIPHPAEVLGPEAHPQLVRILSRALAPSPADRYATAAALQEDLEAYLRSRGGSVSARSIGRALHQHFAADRIRLNAAIDQQLRASAQDADPFDVVSLSSFEAWRHPSDRADSVPHAFPGSMSAHSIASPPARASRYGAAKAMIAGVVGAAVLVVVGWDAVRAKVLGIRGDRPVAAGSASSSERTGAPAAASASAPAVVAIPSAAVTLSPQALPREAHKIVPVRSDAGGAVVDRAPMGAAALSPVVTAASPTPAAARVPGDLNLSLPEPSSPKPPKDRAIDPTDPYSR
jgi:serine/threonine-protein kinase